MSSFLLKCSKFDEDFKNGEKSEKLFLVFWIIEFDIVAAD